MKLQELRRLKGGRGIGSPLFINELDFKDIPAEHAHDRADLAYDDAELRPVYQGRGDVRLIECHGLKTHAVRNSGASPGDRTIHPLRTAAFMPLKVSTKSRR